MHYLFDVSNHCKLNILVQKFGETRKNQFKRISLRNMVIKTIKNKNYRAKLNENDRQNTTLCHISVAKKETPSLHP